MNRSKTLIALMAGIVFAASIALFFLFTNEEARDIEAWLSLGMVIFAEFLLSAQLLRGARPGARSTPGDAVRVSILTLYLVGVIAAAVLGSGLFRMPLRGYLVVHILLGVALSLTFGSVSLFDRQGVTTDAKTRAERLRLRNLSLEVQGIRDRIEGRLGTTTPGGSPGSLNDLLDVLRTVQEKLKYSDPVGTPDIETEEAEIDRSIGELKSAVDDALKTRDPESRLANTSTLAKEIGKRIDRRNERLSALK